MELFNIKYNTYLNFEDSFSAESLKDITVLADIEKFQILIGVSLTKSNFVQYTSIEKFTKNLQPDSYLNQNLYLSICFKPTLENSITDTKIEEGYERLLEVSNRLVLNDIKLGDTSIVSKKYQVLSSDQTYRELTTFNLYDNYSVLVRNWLNQCRSICMSHGIPVVYFRTEPKETVHTLKVHNIRNVADIKKIFVMFPNGEIPTNRIVYTDWDMPLQDDFLIHIVPEIFQQAFGDNFVPNEKDFIYIPMLDKMYRVSTAQPFNRFMGVAGWWECFLAKYEEDETVTKSNNEQDSIRIEDYFELDFEEESEETISDSQLVEYLDDTMISQERLDSVEIVEKREATDNFRNVAKDSTSYINLRETETLREFVDNRLEIISVNPDQSSQPINMYDCTTIDKRTEALTYNVCNWCYRGKLQNTISSLGFQVSFDYVLTHSFVGEILTVQTSHNFDLFQICQQRKKLKICDIITQKDYNITAELETNELYKVYVNFTGTAYHTAIYKFVNGDKILVHEQINNMDKSQLTSSLINKDIIYLKLYGGKFYFGRLTLFINNKKILTDTCRPLLVR